MKQSVLNVNKAFISKLENFSVSVIQTTSGFSLSGVFAALGGSLKQHSALSCIEWFAVHPGTSFPTKCISISH